MFTTPTKLSEARVAALPRLRHAAVLATFGLLAWSGAGAQELPDAPSAALGQSYAGTDVGMEGASAELSDVSSLTDAELPAAPGVCAIEGVVRGVDGGIVPGAAVEVSGEGQAALRSAVTDAEGRYSLPGLPCGQFSLRVSMQGFQPAALAATLPPEGGTAHLDLTLKLGTSDAVTVVATQKEIAAAELHLQEQQRMAGVFPNFFVSYQWRAASLSSGQKFKLALRNATDPGNLFLVGAVAGVEQGFNSFPGYGQGAAGYGRRYGAAAVNLVIGTFLGGAILPSIFKQDPRYFYRGSGSTRSRAWYAVSRAFVTRGDNGKTEVNWSSMLGDMGSGAIGNAYYAPEDRSGAGVTVGNGLLAIAGDCFNNLMQEFVLRKFTTKTKGRHGQAADAP